MAMTGRERCLNNGKGDASELGNKRSMARRSKRLSAKKDRQRLKKEMDRMN